jgi:hypothetical protein
VQLCRQARLGKGGHRIRRTVKLLAPTGLIGYRVHICSLFLSTIELNLGGIKTGRYIGELLEKVFL